MKTVGNILLAGMLVFVGFQCATDSEREVNIFCNELEIGESKQSVLDKAKGIAFTELRSLDNGQRFSLRSNGTIVYSWCVMEFENQKLSYKVLSIS